jgi:hypothetical protein
MSELQKAQSEMSVELSDEELERVAGGQACGDSTVWG